MEPPATVARRLDHAGAGLPLSVRTWPAAAGESSGPASRPALFLCHGRTDSASVFEPVARALGDRWPVAAADAPGHGGSSWRASWSYRVAPQSAPMLAVLDRLPDLLPPFGGVVVHGHSMGALTAARLAAARPGQVRHLVLEEPVLADPWPSLARWARDFVGERRMLPWARRLRRMTDAELAVEALTDNPGWSVEEARLWGEAKRRMSLLAVAVPMVWGTPLTALLDGVGCPVTLVHGSTSVDVVGPAAAGRIAEHCRGGCEIVTLRTGHNVRREDPEGFATVLRDVLERYV